MTPRPYVSPHFDVIDARGKVSVRVHRPDDDDPGICVLEGHDGEDEIHIDTAHLRIRSNETGKEKTIYAVDWAMTWRAE